MIPAGSVIYSMDQANLPQNPVLFTMAPGFFTVFNMATVTHRLEDVEGFFTGLGRVVSKMSVYGFGFRVAVQSF